MWVHRVSGFDSRACLIILAKGTPSTEQEQRTGNTWRSAIRRWHRATAPFGLGEHGSRIERTPPRLAARQVAHRPGGPEVLSGGAETYTRVPKAREPSPELPNRSLVVATMPAPRGVDLGQFVGYTPTGLFLGRDVRVATAR